MRWLGVIAAAAAILVTAAPATGVSDIGCVHRADLAGFTEHRSFGGAIELRWRPGDGALADAIASTYDPERDPEPAARTLFDRGPLGGDRVGFYVFSTSEVRPGPGFTTVTCEAPVEPVVVLPRETFPGDAYGPVVLAHELFHAYQLASIAGRPAGAPGRLDTVPTEAFAAWFQRRVSTEPLYVDLYGHRGFIDHPEIPLDSEERLPGLEPNERFYSLGARFLPEVDQLRPFDGQLGALFDTFEQRGPGSFAAVLDEYTDGRLAETVAHFWAKQVPETERRSNVQAPAPVVSATSGGTVVSLRAEHLAAALRTITAPAGARRVVIEATQAPRGGFLYLVPAQGVRLPLQPGEPQTLCVQGSMPGALPFDGRANLVLGGGLRDAASARVRVRSTSERCRGATRGFLSCGPPPPALADEFPPRDPADPYRLEERRLAWPRIVASNQLFQALFDYGRDDRRLYALTGHDGSRRRTVARELFACFGLRVASIGAGPAPTWAGPPNDRYGEAAGALDAFERVVNGPVPLGNRAFTGKQNRIDFAFDRFVLAATGRQELRADSYFACRWSRRPPRPHTACTD